ncbi:MAG: ABC transporter substrate-binding protein [Eubacterium sp.]|jgi:oligogalacturonide transport system substrate-binding protein|nr:ABC transporter substrate-binding protein [Eubacterium sp.]
MKIRKLIAISLGVTMLASFAACTPQTTEPATTQPISSDETSAAVASETTGSDTTISFSWWGGDERHNATLDAIAAFEAQNPGIKVDSQYAAWTGWEEAMATKFFSNTAPDMNQINWNWISQFSGDGSKFADINQYSNIIDLTQFDQASLDQCFVADKLQAVPVSMTGRIFYWNKTTFDNAGIETPNSLEDLYAAADAFKSNLGEDYFPLVMGEYDRAILLPYYLESKYGKAWVENNVLQYSVEEIADGLQFFSDLEAGGVIPTIQMVTGDGAESLDKNPKWINGRYAGIFEWDSSATKFRDALDGEQEFVVGNYFADLGESQGGFAKVSLAFAISESSQNKEACAQLMEYLLNDDTGTAILGSQRGIPLSKKAIANTDSKGLLDPLVKEANEKVLAWVKFPLDPKFEDARLKNTDGTYYDAFSGLSYGDYDAQTAAQILADGINAVLAS